MGICISKQERNRLVYSAHESVQDKAALVEPARVFARGSDYATRSAAANQLELSSYNVQFFDESEGAIRLLDSSDAAMRSSSPCNSRSNSCISSKACRWSFCTGKSAADAMDEPSFAKSTTPKRRSVKAVQDSIYSPPTAAPIMTCKVDMAQSLPTGAHTAAPIMTKLEMPKSSLQGKHSAQIMNELPQPLSPASAKQTNLFCTVETGKPKSLDHASTLSAARPCSNLASLQILPSTFLSMAGTPGPMWVQSSGEHEQSLGSGVLQLGQDQMLSWPVLQSTNAGRLVEDSSDGYIRNAAHSSMDSFRQQSSATTQGHLDHTCRPSVRNPTEWQVPMLGSISDAPLPYLEADDAARSITGAGQQIMAQVLRPRMLTSVPQYFEMGLSAWNKDPGISQRTSKNGDELEVIGHISNPSSVKVRGGKKHALQKEPTCLAFVSLHGLPSSFPLEEYKNHSSEKLEQGIQQLQKSPNSSEEQQDIQDLSNNYSSEREQGTQHLSDQLEQISVQPLYKDPSSEEEQSIRQIYENYSLALENHSGASSPTSTSSGGVGSAFGSPISIAASGLSSSEYQSRYELIKRLRSYSHQSQSNESCIQASISSTFPSTDQEPPNIPFNAACSSLRSVNQNSLHATGEKKFTDVVHYLLEDRFAYRYVALAGTASRDHALPTDKRNPQWDVAVQNAHRLAQRMGDECVSKRELNEIDSDSSSDLFDLESLVGCGEGADHGLPVSEMRNESRCMSPASLLTVSDSSLCNASVMLLGGDGADHGIPKSRKQLYERQMKGRSSLATGSLFCSRRKDGSLF